MAKFQKGQSGNPGGMTAHEAESRRLLKLWLGGPETRAKFQKAYWAALDDGNPAVVVDCANRLMGKVKDELELSESEDRPLRDAAISKLLALADSLK